MPLLTICIFLHIHKYSFLIKTNHIIILFWDLLLKLCSGHLFMSVYTALLTLFFPHTGPPSEGAIISLPGPLTSPLVLFLGFLVGGGTSILQSVKGPKECCLDLVSDWAFFWICHCLSVLPSLFELVGCFLLLSPLILPLLSLKYVCCFKDLLTESRALWRGKFSK